MHHRLFLLARQSHLPLSVGILSGLLAGLSSLAQAYGLSATIDAVFLRHQTLLQVRGWIELLLVVAVVRGSLLWIQEIVASEVAIRVKKDVRERLFEHLLHLGPSFSRGERTGELTATAVGGIEALDAYFSQYLPQLFISVLVPLAILVVVFPLDLLSGVILLLTAPLIPFFMYMIGRSAETATTRQYETLGRLASHFLDSLQGLTTLKLFGQSTAHANNIARVADQFRVATLKVLQVSFLSAFSLELLATISTAIIAVEVGLRLLYAQMGFREALFLLILAPDFYQPLRTLGVRFHAGMKGTAAARRIFEILDTPVASKASAAASYHPAPIGNQTPPISTAGGASPGEEAIIQLARLSYTYPGRDVPAIVDVDISIRAGEHVALVGASGAGKSTLVALLLGFIQPIWGRVLINGRPPHRGLEADRASLVTWVPQQPYLFNDSIAANIRLGRPDSTDSEVRQATRLAHLDEFVQSLPQGYATPIGEGGARLSSGEGQRLALARAFLMDAPILILDEPSSSLDPGNEVMLEESLRALASGKTVITIAHRLNTVRRADRIIVMHEGRMCEQGTHAELLERKGAYSRLVRARVDPFSPGTGARSATSRAGSLGKPAASFPFHIPVFPEPGKPLAVANLDQPSIPVALGILPRLLGFLNGLWGLVALSVVLGSLTIGSGIALMGTSAWLISAAALHPSIAALYVAIVGVRFFGIARAVFRYLERLISHSVTFRMLRNVRVWFYARLEPLAPARLMDFRAGDVVARAIADVETLENFYVRVLAPPITALCVAVGTWLFLLYSNAPQLATLAACLFVVVGLVLPITIQIMARRPGCKIIADRAVLHSTMVDDIQGMADLVAFGRASDRVHQIRTYGANYTRAQRAMARLGGLQAGVTSAVINSALWITLLVAIPRIGAGTTDGIMLASLALIILASFEAVSPLPQAGHLWPATREAAARLFEMVDEPAVRAIPPPRVQVIGDITPPHTTAEAVKAIPAGDLEFIDVAFSYPGRARPALRNISFRLAAGGSLGVVGPSGAGKSSIANLLLRFWERDAGEIRIGGMALESFAPERIREQIGVVSQPAHFFDTSVYENLRLARRGVTREQVEQAARRARIHDHIETLPQGYDTMIGEHGLRMSAGERQRLAIARVLIKDAPFLILDEPTANLDTVNEAEILSALFGLMRRKTTLHIAHRLVGMEELDEIMVMDQGKVVERGSHDGLLARGGLYARLVALQKREASGALELLASST